MTQTSILCPSSGLTYWFLAASVGWVFQLWPILFRNTIVRYDYERFSKCPTYLRSAVYNETLERSFNNFCKLEQKTDLFGLAREILRKNFSIRFIFNPESTHPLRLGWGVLVIHVLFPDSRKPLKIMSLCIMYSGSERQLLF